MNNQNIIDAHQYCTGNRTMLKKDKACGCFYCLKIYSPKEIKNRIKDKEGKTAMCAYCGIDSVIGESSGYPLTTEFLKEMKEYWF